MSTLLYPAANRLTTFNAYLAALKGGIDGVGKQAYRAVASLNAIAQFGWRRRHFPTPHVEIGSCAQNFKSRFVISLETKTLCDICTSVLKEYTAREMIALISGALLHPLENGRRAGNLWLPASAGCFIRRR